MRQRSHLTINALILEAAARNDFGITKASLSRDLVLSYQKVNEYCEDLVNKHLLDYNSATRTYHATSMGREMLKLSEQLWDHYSPVNHLLAKYRTRIDKGATDTRERTRQILKETYRQGVSKLKVAAASPLFMVEHLFVYFDECIVQVLPC